MNDELFDEPRKCPTCKVVTYCDNCPVCGRGLPRSSKAMWNLTHKNDTAGEESLKNGVNHESFEKRILESVHQSDKRTSARMDNATHVDPDVSFDQKNTRTTYRNIRDVNSNIGQGMVSVNAKIIAFVVVCLIILALVFSLSGDRVDNILNSSSASGLRSNSNEIISDDFKYYATRDESSLSLVNQSDKVYYGDLVFFGEDDRVVGEYEELIIFPYEEFELEIYTIAEAVSFEIEESNLYEIDAEVPSIEYTTYNDYGYLTAYIEKDISRNDLEILVRYLYKASTIDEYELIYNLEVQVDNEMFYDCYIDDYDGIVTVFPSDEAVLIQDMYDFNLSGNTIEKGITKDIHL